MHVFPPDRQPGQQLAPSARRNVWELYWAGMPWALGPPVICTHSGFKTSMVARCSHSQSVFSCLSHSVVRKPGPQRAGPPPHPGDVRECECTITSLSLSPSLTLSGSRAGSHLVLNGSHAPQTALRVLQRLA